MNEDKENFQKDANSNFPEWLTTKMETTEEEVSKLEGRSLEIT